MSIISDVQEYLEAMPFSVKVALCIFGIIFALLGARFALIKPWEKIVKESSAGWDDLLHGPLSVRLNLFILVVGGQLSTMWLIESDVDYNLLQPYFGASYILIATSISSVATKYLMPLILEQFQKRDAVTLSGGNPVLVICTRGTLYFVGLYFALNELGIDLFVIFASLAVISLIIGIAMQQTISNIANSFLLAIDKPFEVGDRIEVGDILGTVVSIGVLSTKVLDRDERLVIIPNNTIVSSDIINHARGGGEGIGSRKSLIIDIGVSYDEDIDHVKYVMLKLARDCPQSLDKPEPRVLVNELDEYSKMLRLYAWVENYNEEWVARDWLLKSIDESFNQEGISISYPTAIEISTTVEKKKDAEKANRQKHAREQMAIEEQRLLDQKEQSRKDVKELSEQISSPSLPEAKVSDSEFDAQAFGNS
jgi:small-conductance mechanosensitive channel